MTLHSRLVGVSSEKEILAGYINDEFGEMLLLCQIFETFVSICQMLMMFVV